jgi:uncharacterized protein (TIGR02099 family)
MRLALPSLRLPSGRAFLRAVLWSLFFLYVGFAALTLALRYWLLPELPRYQPEIEAAASRILGAPVRIGRLEAHWRGLNPALRLEDTRILDATGEIALRLTQVDGALSWRSLFSLWRGEPRFALLTLEKPELSIRRDKAGHIFIAGILLAGSKDDDAQALNWLFQQSRLRIHDASITWQDESRAAPPLFLRNARLEWRNNGKRHVFGLTAQPPETLAAKLELRGEFLGNATAWRDWRGQLYARLDAVDLAGGRPWFDAPIELERGRGAARLWLQGDRSGWQGTGDLALANARLRLDATLPMLDLARLTGRLRVTRAADSWRVSSHDLNLEVRAANQQTIRIADLNLQLEWQGKQFPPRQGALFADTLDLFRLRQLAAWLPLPTASRSMLATYQPTGMLRQVRLSWEMGVTDHNGDNFKKYSLEAGFSNLGIKAAGVLPGASGLSGTLSANEQGGRLALESQKIGIALPAVFASPEFPLDRLRAEVDWLRNKEGVRTDIRRLEFLGPHANGKVSGHYQSLPEGPGRIDLQGEFTQAKATEVWRYIPRVSNPRVADWLRGALQAGSGEGQLRLRGDLARFPFGKPDDDGEFRITVKARDVKLKYGDDWPEIEAIDGDLEFGAGMRILARTGRVLGARLHNTQVDIPRFTHNSQLLVAGEASGPTAEFLRFIDQSPVAASIGRFTRDMTAAGQGKLELKLDLPLSHIKDGKVWGRYHLENDTLAFTPGLPPIQEARGSLEFTEDSVNAPEIRGVFLGAPMRLKITTDTTSVKTVRIEANGGFTARELARHYNYPGLAALSGSASWQAEMRVRKKTTEFLLMSSLAGLASSLPAPFAKNASENLPFSLQKTTLPNAREQIRVSLGNDAQRRLDALFVRQANGAIERGAIGIGQSPRLPDKGLNILIRQDELDLDTWVLAGGVLADGVSTGSRSELARSGLSLVLLALESQKLTAFGRVFDGVSLRLRPDGERMRITVASRAVVGDLYWDSANQGKITADLRRMRLDSGQASLTERAEGNPPKLTDSLPGMDIRIEDFTFNKRRFGRVALQAENVGKLWRLNQIVIENPDGKLTGNGIWRPGATGRSDLDFSLEATDSGKLLERMGYPGALRGGTATLSGQLNWAGSPLEFNTATLGGALRLAAARGQFAKVSPGVEVGKLLGLLSLQSMSRRLSLDFRDIFSDGFTYDRITAQMRIKDGVMTTDGDLQIIAPSGKALMNGTVDMKNETQALRLTMQPELGGVAAMGAAVAINPLVGAAALLAQNFLKNPLNKVFSLKYSVTGSWTDPKVERLPAPQNESALPTNTPTEGKTP